MANVTTRLLEVMANDMPPEEAAALMLEPSRVERTLIAPARDLGALYKAFIQGQIGIGRIFDVASDLAMGADSLADIADRVTQEYGRDARPEDIPMGVKEKDRIAPEDETVEVLRVEPDRVVKNIVDHIKAGYPPELLEFLYGHSQDLAGYLPESPEFLYPELTEQEDPEELARYIQQRVDAAQLGGADTAEITKLMTRLAQQYGAIGQQALQIMRAKADRPLTRTMPVAKPPSEIAPPPVQPPVTEPTVQPELARILGFEKGSERRGGVSVLKNMNRSLSAVVSNIKEVVQRYNAARKKERPWADLLDTYRNLTNAYSLLGGDVMVVNDVANAAVRAGYGDYPVGTVSQTTESLEEQWQPEVVKEPYVNAVRSLVDLQKRAAGGQLTYAELANEIVPFMDRSGPIMAMARKGTRKAAGYSPISWDMAQAQRLAQQEPALPAEAPPEAVSAEVSPEELVTRRAGAAIEPPAVSEPTIRSMVRDRLLRGERDRIQARYPDLDAAPRKVQSWVLDDFAKNPDEWPEHVQRWATAQRGGAGITTKGKPWAGAARLWPELVKRYKYEPGAPEAEPKSAPTAAGALRRLGSAGPELAARAQKAGADVDMIDRSVRKVSDMAVALARSPGGKGPASWDELISTREGRRQGAVLARRIAGALRNALDRPEVLADEDALVRELFGGVKAAQATA